MLSKKEQQLMVALNPRALQEGVEIVAVEVVGAKKAPTIRVLIDTPDGVSFDELTSSQVWINEIMDDLDPFPGAYTLEVSSPGIDRPLCTLEHFGRFVGKTVTVKAQPQEGRGSWTGVISQVCEGVVTLDVDGNCVDIPFDTMKRAHLKGTIDFSS